jgi:hypothetical protein
VRLQVPLSGEMLIYIVPNSRRRYVVHWLDKLVESHGKEICVKDSRSS